MDLKTYLKKHKLSTYSFAKQCPRVSQPTVWRLINNIGTPSVATAKNIEKATGGDVPAEETLALLS